MNIDYYVIEALMDDENIPTSMFSARGNGEPLFVGPNTRLSTSKCAEIDEEDLAWQFRDGILPRYIKRYGENVELKVLKQQHVSSGYSEKADNKVLAKIQSDSSIVRERVRTGNYASNKAVFIK